MRLILLHSPVLTAASWAAVAQVLQGRGVDAHAPAWARLAAVDGDVYAELAAGLADKLGQGDGEAMLVAHSGAGALVPSLAQAMSRPPAGVIFADALMPHPGRSWFDTAPAEFRAHLRAGAVDGLLPAWDQWWPPGALERLLPDEAQRRTLTDGLEPLPAAFFEATAPQVPLQIPAAFLQLSGAYDDEARLAGRQGWPVVRLPLHHLAMVTHAEAVAAALESLSERLLGR